MITIHQNKTVLPDREGLQSLWQSFRLEHCIVLDQLLHESLATMINGQIASGSYKENKQINSQGTLFGSEETFDIDKTPLKNILMFLLNGDQFIKAMRMVLGIPAISYYHGRVYKIDAEKEGFLQWHDDLATKEKRLAAMSVNLSTEPYEGGDFVIRGKKKLRVFKTVNHKTWGAAHIFRVHKALEHSVAPVTGHHPRIVCAGWFYPKESE